jgi:hypothetical protein
MGFPLVANYVPKRISSRVAYLVSEESRVKAEFSPEPWARLAPEVFSKFLPGNHLGCVAEHAATTARVLDELFQPVAQ